MVFPVYEINVHVDIEHVESHMMKNFIWLIIRNH